MVDNDAKNRFARAVERELVAGQRREPLWSDLLSQAEGDQRKAKEEYIRIRVDQLVVGENDRRKKRRRKRKKRSYTDRNAMSLLLGRKVIMITAAAVVVGVALVMLLLNHDEDTRWFIFSEGAGSQISDPFNID